VETVRFVFNGANQIECLDVNVNSQCEYPEDIPFIYDLYGNLLDSCVKTYSNDADNQLISVTDYLIGQSDGLSMEYFTHYGLGSVR
jgi:hypothetical protein